MASMPGPSAPPERPRQLSATTNNFPGGGGCTLGICPRSPDHQISSRQITRSARRLPSLGLTGSAWTRSVLEWPRRSGLFNLPLKGWGVRTSGASENLHLWRKHLEVVLHPSAKAGAGIGRKRGSSPFCPPTAQPEGDEGSNPGLPFQAGLSEVGGAQPSCGVSRAPSRDPRAGH